MNCKNLFWAVLIAAALTGSWAEAAEDTRVYLKARQFARGKNYDFAFMQYRWLARQFPESRYIKESLFAEGEYFFLVPDYTKAAEAFEEFIRLYPADEAKLFALAYLHKIAKLQGEKDLSEQYARDIVTFRQLSLVFRDFKVYQYRSPLEYQHRAVFHIDTIEFLIGGKPFAKLSY